MNKSALNPEVKTSAFSDLSEGAQSLNQSV